MKKQYLTKKRRALIIKVFKEIIKQIKKEGGGFICNKIQQSDLIEDKEEMLYILNYFQEQVPSKTQHISFYEHTKCILKYHKIIEKGKTSTPFWSMNEVKERVRFLKVLINNLKE